MTASIVNHLGLQERSTNSQNIRNKATPTGLEPATSSSTGRRSTTELRSHASTIRLSITMNNFIIATETIIQQKPANAKHRRVALSSGNATATPTGFEPATSAVTGRHSNQAELRSHKHNTLLLSKSNATDEVHLISATKIQYSALTRQFKSSACRAGPSDKTTDSYPGAQVRGRTGTCRLRDDCSTS